MNSRTQFKASPKLTVSLHLWDERVLSEASSDMAVGGGRNQRSPWSPGDDSGLHGYMCI